MQPQNTPEPGADVDELVKKGWTPREAIDYLDMQDSGSGRRRSSRPYDDRYDFMNEYNNQQDGYTTDRYATSKGYQELGGSISDGFPTALRL
jgi:hypothetical protein